MKVEVISPMYNEAAFIPFFLKHYAWVDKITVLFGSDSTDNSRELLMADPKVVIIEAQEPEGINDEVRIRRINETYQASDADWVIHADADEFMLIDRAYLEAVKPEYNFLSLKVVQIIPHVDDLPLDINKPILQRRHGYWHNMGRPVILRTKQNITLGIGKHVICGDARKDPAQPIMAHWQMIDKDICLHRRMVNRGKRMSQYNIDRKWGWHETLPDLEQVLLKEFEDHKNDPILI